MAQSTAPVFQHQSKTFNLRSFITCAMASAGLILPFSGFMLHSTAFDPFTQVKHAWMTVHNSAGLLFVVFAIWHLTLNWKPMAKHFRNAAARISGIRKEAILGMALVFGLVALVTMHAFHVH